MYGRGFRGGRPWWQRRFRGRGYRMTAPRMAILDVLSKSEKHLSAEDIFIQVHKVYPGIGLTTVYRTLELLVNMGIVTKFDFGDRRSRYELTQGPGHVHHHHLVCLKCGRVIDYSEFVEKETKVIGEIEEALSKKYKFDIKDHMIRFIGFCERCKEKQEE